MNEYGSRITSPGIHRVMALAVLALAGTFVTATVVSSPIDAGARSKRFKPKAGNYEGKTAQGLAVSFKVRNGKIRKAEWSVSAGICTTTSFQSTSATKVSRKRKFSITSGDNRLTGKFVNRRKVRGGATVDFSDNYLCPSVIRTVKYTARRR